GDQGLPGYCPGHGVTEGALRMAEHFAVEGVDLALPERESAKVTLAAYPTILLLVRGLIRAVGDCHPQRPTLFTLPSSYANWCITSSSLEMEFPGFLQRFHLSAA